MQTRELIPMWVLMVISCCAVLVALTFMYVFFTQTREWFAADPYCVAPIGPFFPVLSMIEELRTAWLIWGVASLLSWPCAFVARRSASASTRGLRRTTTALLWLSSLALVGLACSFGWFELTCYGLRLA